MLEYTKESIAMGNSNPVIFDHVTYKTTDINDDGVFLNGKDGARVSITDEGVKCVDKNGKVTYQVTDNFAGNQDPFVYGWSSSSADFKFQNGKQIGDVTLVSKDWFQLRAKSPIPKHLQRKVFKGMDGKPLE